MVIEYIRENKYSIGNLKPFIYLLPRNEDTKINVAVDNDDFVTTFLSYKDCYKVEGVKVSFTQEMGNSSRHSYSGNTTITLKEQKGELWTDALESIAVGKWYVIFEDKENTRYLMTPEFYASISWTYTINNSTNDGNTCELSFKTDSNIPCSILEDSIVLSHTESLSASLCTYEKGRISSLKLIERGNVLLNNYDGSKRLENVVTLNEKDFTTVEPIESTIVYRQDYNDGKYTDTLSFSIPLNKYRRYFPMALEEFKNNRYVAMIATEMDVTAFIGSEFGLYPKYTITSSEEDSNLNTIAITLTHNGNEGFSFTSDKEPSIIKDNTLVKVPVEDLTDPTTGYDLDTYVCVGSNTAIRTILEARTISNEPTGKYYVLQGYEEMYKNLNIIGTYTQNDSVGLSNTFVSERCNNHNLCKFVKKLPNTLNFYGNGYSVEAVLKAECDWTITEQPTWLEISPTSGKSNEETIITMTCLQDPSENPLNGRIVASTEYNSTVCNTFLQTMPKWLDSLVYNISARQQTVEIPHTTDNITVVSYDSGITSVTKDKNLVYVKVSENPNETERTLSLVLSNGEENATVLINQSKLYVSWVVVNESDYVCDGTSSYKVEYKYKGYSPDKIEILTDETRKGELLQADDNRCKGMKTRYVNVEGQTLCMGDDAFEKLMMQVSYDNGATWADTETFKTGNLVERKSPECNDSYSWVATDKTICDGTSLYTVEEKFLTEDGVSTSLGETRLGSLVEELSQECMKENSLKFTFTCTGTTSSESSLGYITASTDVVIDWGDGKTTTAENPLLYYMEHVYTSSGTYTVTLNGAVSDIGLSTPQDLEGYTLNAIDLTEAYELRRYQSLCNHNVEIVDLSNNSLLRNFIMDDTVGTGSFSFTFPIKSSLEYVRLCNEKGKPSNLSQEVLQGIVDHAPNGNGLFKFCHNEIDGVSQVCGLVEKNGWKIDKSCCEVEGSIKYRTVENGDYECDLTNHTKWAVSVVQKSIYTNGAWSEWEDTDETKRVDVLEYKSPDCGYSDDKQYRWTMTEDYICEGTTSYYAEVKEYSTDGGNTWNKVVPEVKRASTTMKMYQDPDCGYSDGKQYRWIEDGYICKESEIELETRWVENGYVCDGYNKYQMLKQQKKYADETEWVDTGETKQGELVEANSSYCGYDLRFKYEMDGQTTFVDGVEYYIKWEYKSEDGGNTWIPTGEYILGDVVPQQDVLWVFNSKGTPKYYDGYTWKLVDTDENGLYYYRLEGAGTSLSFNDVDKLISGGSADTSNVTRMDSMFYDCESLTSLDLRSFNTSKVTKMSNMFYWCSSLTSLDLRSFNTSNVMSMDKMFYECNSLTSLDVSNFDTSNLTDMYYMFYGCSSLTSLDLRSFNTSNVENMDYLFAYCSGLTSIDVSSFNTSNVTYMRYMFCLCSSLTSLDLSNFDTSNVRDMNNMFSGCYSLTSLDLSNFDTSNVGNMEYMFRNCSSLTSLDLSNFNTSKVTNTQYMFDGCSSLTSFDLSNFNTSILMYMPYMFRDCSSLTSLDLSGWDTTNVRNTSCMFTNCSSLTQVKMIGCNDSTVSKIQNALSSDGILDNVTIIQ